MDLRRRVIRARREEGLTYKELAARYQVGPATVSRWLRRERETGDVKPRQHGGGRRRKIGREQMPLLEALVKSHPDWSEDEYAEALMLEQGIEASAATVGRRIRELGYTVKKRASSRASATNPTSYDGDTSTENASEESTFRVWFSWTKPA